ncbi:hypothetical protein [Nostoc sp.]|uniref:hypothetical protein n=1 Tax=Nostoc sp. TaxID=1180 RepID=UPI002FF8C4DC
MTNTQKMVRFNLDLSPELNQILDELAKKIGTTKSDVLRQTITLMQIMVIVLNHLLKVRTRQFFRSRGSRHREFSQIRQDCYS